MPLTLAATSALVVPAMDVGSKIFAHLSSRTGKAQLQKAKDYIGQGLDILDSKNGKLLHPALRLEFATALVK